MIFNKTKILLVSALFLTSSNLYAQSVTNEPSFTFLDKTLNSQANDDISRKNTLENQNNIPLKENPKATNPNQVQSGAFVFNMPKNPDDWVFLMGPAQSETMSLKLIRTTKDGSMGFLCNRQDGSQSVAVRMNGLYAQPGEKKEFHVIVGSDDRVLSMVNKDNIETNNSDKKDSQLTNQSKQENDQQSLPIFEADGQAVAVLLDRMGQIGENSVSYITFNAGNNHSLSFLLPVPRGTATTAAQVCDGWAKIAEERAGHPRAPLNANLPNNNPNKVVLFDIPVQTNIASPDQIKR